MHAFVPLGSLLVVVALLLTTFLPRCARASRLELEKVYKDLDVLEFTTRKTLQEASMNACEEESYASLYSEIEKDISQAQTDIAGCRSELVKAQQVRRNRMEYDAIARVSSRKRVIGWHSCVSATCRVVLPSN